MILVNVKLDISVYMMTITFQSWILHRSRSFLMAQLKVSWQYWHSCIAEILWKSLLLGLPGLVDCVTNHSGAVSKFPSRLFCDLTTSPVRTQVQPLLGTAISEQCTHICCIWIHSEEAIGILLLRSPFAPATFRLLTNLIRYWSILENCVV